jgi:hypothetical protein
MEEQDSKLMWGEDNEYLWCYIFLCSQIVITHRISYYYRYNPLSICHNEAAKPNKLRERIIMNDEMMKFMANHGCTDRDIHLFKRWYARELMGHLENEHLPKDMLPVEWHHRYGDALDNNRIVLYGAGNVGCDYYRAFKKQLSKQDIFWTDKRWQEKQNDYIDIRPVDELHGFDYDYVVIAVAEEPLAAQIREELVTSGVEDQKILWKKPLNMREL